MKKKTNAKRDLVVDKSDAERVQLRDYFATFAMSALLTNEGVYQQWRDSFYAGESVPTPDEWRSMVARCAYKNADAMLSAREAKP